MRPCSDSDFFRKTFPKWAKFALIASIGALLAFAISASAPSVIPRDFGKVFFVLWLLGFGVSIAASMFHGIKIGYLPSRFNVSRTNNAIQFWLTIVLMLCFAAGLLYFGGTGLFALVTK